MNTDKFKYYRKKVYEYIQKEIIPKYSEIKYCTMEVYSEHLDWDVGFIFRQNESRFNFKSFKSTDILEREIRYSLQRYCDEIGANDYYFFILLTFV